MQRLKVVNWFVSTHLSHFLLYWSAFLPIPDLTRNLFLKVAHTFSKESVDTQAWNYMEAT